MSQTPALKNGQERSASKSADSNTIATAIQTENLTGSPLPSTSGQNPAQANQGGVNGSQNVQNRLAGLQGPQNVVQSSQLGPRPGLKGETLAQTGAVKPEPIAGQAIGPTFHPQPSIQNARFPGNTLGPTSSSIASVFIRISDLAVIV